jgi:hypothetical protein
LPGKLVCLFMMGGTGALIFLLQRSAEEKRELLSLVLPDDDKPPGSELAMVRHTHGDFEDLPKLLI